MKLKKLMNSMSVLAMILILYSIHKILPYHLLAYTISLGWILIFAAFVFFIIIMFRVAHSAMRQCWKIVWFCFLGFLLMFCVMNSFLTDDFMSLLHTSTIVKSPSDDRTVVIVQSAEWSGSTFHIYEKKYGFATHLHTEHTETSFQSRRYKCQWSEDNISIGISDDEMAYHNFDVPLN